MAVGCLEALVGVFCIFNNGVEFISLAFPVGLSFIISGLSMSISYKVASNNNESKHWALIDGVTTIVLGVTIITGQIVSSDAVKYTFFMWLLISGVRSLVLFIDKTDDIMTKGDAVWNLGIATASILLSIYTIFDSLLIQLYTVNVFVAFAIILHSFVLIKLGSSMAYVKPSIIKDKSEIVREYENEIELLEGEAEEARQKAREAILAARNLMVEEKIMKVAAMEAQLDLEETLAARDKHEEIINEPIEELTKTRRSRALKDEIAENSQEVPSEPLAKARPSRSSKEESVKPKTSKASQVEGSKSRTSKTPQAEVANTSTSKQPQEKVSKK